MASTNSSVSTAEADVPTAPYATDSEQVIDADVTAGTRKCFLCKQLYALGDGGHVHGKGVFKCAACNRKHVGLHRLFGKWPQPCFALLDEEAGCVLACG